MDQPTFAQRFRYWFDNLMARGTSSVMALLGLFSLVVVLLMGFIAWVAHLAPEPDQESLGYIETTWRQLTFTLDPGTFSGDPAWPWRILSLLTTLFGVLVVASLIGVVSAAFDDKIADLRKGRSNVLETGHTVIIGWNPKVFAIISEITVANESEKRAAIVVFADRDKVEMEEEIREKVPNTRTTTVICRSGDPLDQDELLRANPYAARSIILLSDEEAADPDSISIKTALALTNHPKRGDHEIHIVGDIRNPDNLEVALLVGRDEVKWVLSAETTSRITVQTCRQTGLSAVYTELLKYDGDEIYFTEQPTLYGKTIWDAQLAFEDSVVIGVYSDGKVTLNAEPGFVYREGDQLIVLAEDDSTIALAAVPGSPTLDLVTGVGRTDATPERTLILGSNAQLHMMLTELGEYVAPGSIAHVVSELPLPELPELDNMTITTATADVANRVVLNELKPETYDHIIVLAYRDAMDAQQADAKTLITLLQLREISRTLGINLNVVSEMLDDRNRQLAEVTQADDFIVSDNLVSLMMSQISENALLADLFDTLFAPDGAEIYLRPVEWYVKTDTPVDFYTVIEGARRRDETAIGFRLAGHEGAGDGSAEVIVNPKKSESRTYSPGDRIIVLAED